MFKSMRGDDQSKRRSAEGTEQRYRKLLSTLDGRRTDPEPSAEQALAPPSPWHQMDQASDLETELDDLVDPLEDLAADPAPDVNEELIELVDDDQVMKSPSSDEEPTVTLDDQVEPASFDDRGEDDPGGAEDDPGTAVGGLVAADDIPLMDDIFLIEFSDTAFYDDGDDIDDFDSFDQVGSLPAPSPPPMPHFDRFFPDVAAPAPASPKPSPAGENTPEPSKTDQREEPLDLKLAPIAEPKTGLELQPIPELQSNPPATEVPSATLPPDDKEIVSGKRPDARDVIELDDLVAEERVQAVALKPAIDDGDGNLHTLSFPPLRPRQNSPQAAKDDVPPAGEDDGGQKGKAADQPDRQDIGENDRHRSSETAAPDDAVPSVPPALPAPDGKPASRLEIREIPLPAPRSKTTGLHEPPLMAGAGAPIPPPLLATLVVADAPRLRRLAAAMIGDEAIADELVQATIEHALAAPGQVSAERDPGLSLLTILHRLRQHMLDEPTPARKADDADSFIATMLQNLPGADQYELKAFAEAMSSLAEDDRAILLLVALENLSYRDIAGMIKAPIGRVMSKISRARENLRRAMGENGQDETSLVIRSAAYQIAGIELHGYLDGELGDERVNEIQTYLDQDDQASERLMHFGIQGDLIRRLYGPLINRAIPYPMAGRLVAVTRPKTLATIIDPGHRSLLVIGALVLAAAGLGAIWWHTGLSFTEVKASLSTQGWL